jgi:hypothetical protein
MSQSFADILADIKARRISMAIFTHGVKFGNGAEPITYVVHFETELDGVELKIRGEGDTVEDAVSNLYRRAMLWGSPAPRPVAEPVVQLPPPRRRWFG